MRARTILFLLVAAYCLSLILTYVLVKPRWPHMYDWATLTLSGSLGNTGSFGLPEVSLIAFAVLCACVGLVVLIPWGPAGTRGRWGVLIDRIRASGRTAKLIVIFALSGVALDFLATKVFDWHTLADAVQVTFTVWFGYMDPDRVQPLAVHARLFSVVALIATVIVIAKTRSSPGYDSD